MKYISTRGVTAPLTFREAVIAGQAPDGGLLIPSELPDLAAELPRLAALSYAELAFEIFSPFADDIAPATLRELIRRSYTTFDTEVVTPVVTVDGFSIVELFHGPTLAFKDLALQWLGNLFEHVLAETGSELNILGATSGDTGSAAIAGVRGKRGIRIFVMFPDGRTSAVQELQMTTVPDANVHCLAIEGSFDDCQGLMKAVFNDLDFKARYHLGAVNSINWARVLAQIVYYFYAYLRVQPRCEQRVTFSVPTGNFGDVFAGYLASRMGLPVRKLLVATNDNDILRVFFDTGIYRRGAVRCTLSPSMDIQVASNFERYLYFRLGRDPARLRSFMDRFASTGQAKLEQPADGADIFVAGSANREQTLDTMRRFRSRYGYLLDPHSAVGVSVAEQAHLPGPVICLATAHPAKFPEAVCAATGDAHATSHGAIEALHARPTRRRRLPADVEVVKGFIRSVCAG